jgi:hypothetical protein
MSTAIWESRHEFRTGYELAESRKCGTSPQRDRRKSRVGRVFVDVHIDLGEAKQFQGSGFRVQGSGFRVQGSGFRVQGSGFRVQGSGFRVQDSGCRVEIGYEFRTGYE